MGCQSNNATDPAAAFAPGSDFGDPRPLVNRLRERLKGDSIDPRLPAIVPGFDAPFFQAGLAGYSDAAMRLIARRHGCPLCVTEALLDRTVLAGGRGFAKADLGELANNVPGGDEDHPLVGQLMGSDPREMAVAALKMIEQASRPSKAYRDLAYTNGQFPRRGQIQQTSKQSPLREQGVPPSQAINFNQVAHVTHDAPTPFQAIDINLACPVKKIKAKARGGHWLAQPDGAIAIIEAVRETLPAHIPVTLKIRRGYDDTPEMAANFDRILAAAFDIGIAWATVHARTVTQKYVGPSRWDLLRNIVARHPDRLIFGSGDIWSAADVFRMIDYTRVAAVSVARGCIGNPWIFRQARDLLAGNDPTLPTLAQQRAVLESHYTLALAVNANMKQADAFTGKTMRKFAIRFAQHHPQGEEVKRAFIEVSSQEQWRSVLDKFYCDEARI
jgi:tRNA-dihydrouridine synthase B